MSRVSGKMVFKKRLMQFTVTFLVGAFVAGSTVYFSHIYNNSEDGKGGHDYPAQPTYNTKAVSNAQLEDASSDGVFSDAGFDDTVEVIDDDNPNTSTFKPLTYITYRMKSGEYIGQIAERFNVNQDTLISVNNIRNTRTMQIGTYLKIPSEKGILYTIKKDGETPKSIADKYAVDAEKCAFVNNLSLNSELKAGNSIFVPGAAMDAITRAEINGDLFRRPLRARYRLTSYFGWRPSPFTGRRSWHGGLDMACPAWTPIYAGMDGRVEEINYNKTYGNYVIIKHNSGYKTLYGHMVVRTKDVKVGQWVTTNTIIGRVGSTGNSTGNHLHFTVYKNGRMINPLGLLGN